MRRPIFSLKPLERETIIIERFLGVLQTGSGNAGASYITTFSRGKYLVVLVRIHPIVKRTKKMFGF